MMIAWYSLFFSLVPGFFSLFVWFFHIFSLWFCLVRLIFFNFLLIIACCRLLTAMLTKEISLLENNHVLESHNAQEPLTLIIQLHNPCQCAAHSLWLMMKCLRSIHFSNSFLRTHVHCGWIKRVPSPIFVQWAWVSGDKINAGPIIMCNIPRARQSNVNWFVQRSFDRLQILCR